MAGTPRDAFGAHLAGEILEVGPGHEPFPTAPGATVTYADKSVAGGRDETWPELVGAPWGPEADVDVDLDLDGLGAFADDRFDGVVASHVLEHLADPVGALLEVDRVLRPGGLAAVVMPDRHRTFDQVRTPATVAHLLDEHERGVSEVDEAHIRDFCEAIWAQEPIHPEPVRSWHDPAALDAERIDLHRRRSIHVHCWSSDEFVVLVAALVAGGHLGWALVDQFVADDTTPASIEYGLLLRSGGPTGPDAAAALVRAWATGVAGGRPERRVLLADLAATVARDLGSAPAVAASLVTHLAEEADRWRLRSEELEDEVAAVRASATWRAGRLLVAPVDRLRKLRAR